jgi:hypothetical protein
MPRCHFHIVIIYRESTIASIALAGLTMRYQVYVHPARMRRCGIHLGKFPRERSSRTELAALSRFYLGTRANGANKGRFLAAGPGMRGRHERARYGSAKGRQNRCAMRGPGGYRRQRVGGFDPRDPERAAGVPIQRGRHLGHRLRAAREGPCPLLPHRWRA